MGRLAVAVAVAGTILTAVVLLSASLGRPWKDLHNQPQRQRQHLQEHPREQQGLREDKEDKTDDPQASQEDHLLVMLRRLRRGESRSEEDVKESASSSSMSLQASGEGAGESDAAQEQLKDGTEIHGQRHRRVAGTVPVVGRDVDPPCSRSVVEEEAQQEGFGDDSDSGTASPPAADPSCGARLLHLPRTFVTDIFSFLASTSPPSNVCGRPGSCGAAGRPFALPRPPCATQDSWSDGAMEASLRSWEAFAFAAPSAIVASTPPPPPRDDQEEEEVKREHRSPTAAARCRGEDSSANCSQANARRRRDGRDNERAEGHHAGELEDEEEMEKVTVAEFRRAMEQWAAERSEGKTGGADDSDRSSASHDGGAGAHGGDEEGRGGARGARRSHDPLWEVVRSLRGKRAASPGAGWPSGLEAEWPSGLEAVMDRTLVLLLKRLIDTPPMRNPGGGATHFGRLLRHYLNRDDASHTRLSEPRTPARGRESRCAQRRAAPRGGEAARGGRTHGKITKFLVLKAMQAACEQWSGKAPRSVDAVSNARNGSVALGDCGNRCTASKGADEGDGAGRRNRSALFNLCAGCRLRDLPICLCLVYKQYVVLPNHANIRDCAGQCLPTSGCLDLYSNHSVLLLHRQGTRQPLCVPVHYSGLRMLIVDNGNCTESRDDNCDANVSAHIFFYEQSIANECGCR